MPAEIDGERTEMLGQAVPFQVLGRAQGVGDFARGQGEEDDVREDGNPREGAVHYFNLEAVHRLESSKPYLVVTELPVEVSRGCSIGSGSEFCHGGRSGSEEEDQRQDAAPDEHARGRDTPNFKRGTYQPLLIVQTRTELREIVRIEECEVT